ncbi:MAG: peptidoglycan binding protein CsiV, partial [Gammaproteobacteria bacterium]|nr:peptidoglycan binding protein CsiV [Gammaproteobacteria bacterium]
DIAGKLVDSSRYELLLHTAWRQPGVEKEKALPVWIRAGRIYGNEYTSIDSQIELLESMPKAGRKMADGTAYEVDEQTLESIELQMLEQQSSRSQQRLYELEGKITIGLSRYLHAYTDLVLRRPRLSIDQETSSSIQNRTLAAYSADTLILNNHILKERRRMRSKNLHYLDSPEFALLILITPYKVPEVIEEAPPETEPTTVE